MVSRCMQKRGGGTRAVVSRCVPKGGGDARVVVSTRMRASARHTHLGRAAPLGPMALDEPDATIRDALRREPKGRQVAREGRVCVPIRASEDTGT